MCGIFVSACPVSDHRVNRFQRLELARDSLQHRGPDSCGAYSVETGHAAVYLGHTRLSILDLSPNGAQPMHKEDLTLVFNGEIYNYVELRDELEQVHGHKFVTGTDTEVLLTAWIQWGHGALTRLDGMFAFVMLDTKRRDLTLVRDLFGIKPLYYARVDDELIIASEPRALISYDSGLATPNDQACLEFLSAAWSDRGDQTFFKDIHQVLPGHLINFSLESRHLSERMWGEIEVDETTLEGHKKRVISELQSSITRQQRSDVEVGFALSGGLDSSLLCSQAKVVSPSTIIRSHGFTSRGSSFSEHNWQELVSNYLGCEHVEHEGVQSQEWLLDQTLKSLGEPFSSTSLFAQNRLFAGVKQTGTRVILEGQGADELFGGYDSFLAAKIIQALGFWDFQLAWSLYRKLSVDSGSFMKAFSLVVAERVSFGVPTNKLSYLARILFGLRPVKRWVNKAAVAKILVRSKRTSVSVRKLLPKSAKRLQLVLARQIWISSLPTLLKNSDRNSMAQSIESRVPYLTAKMAGYAISFAGTRESLTAESKPMLRNLAQEYLPDTLVHRQDKNGFATRSIDFSTLSLGLTNSARVGLRAFSWLQNDHGGPEEDFFPDLNYNIRFRLLVLGLWRALISEDGYFASATNDST